jgi:hypothetical protein
LHQYQSYDNNAYYDDKGDDGFEKWLLIWRVIDDKWNNTLPRLIHAAGIYLNPAFSYSCGFRFDVEVMDGFLTCVQRMKPSPQEHVEISKEMEIYRIASGTCGFDMAIHDKKTKMPSKLCYHKICTCAKPSTRSQSCATIGSVYHCHLSRDFPCFSDGRRSTTREASLVT